MTTNIKLQFRVTFKSGTRTVAVVDGLKDIANGDTITVGDMENIIQTERFLERLTGLRVHIDQVQ